MAELSLPDILNECLDRLAAGQSITDCLSAYPAQAARLRPLLDSGLAATRMNFPVGEVTLVQERIWARMDQAFNAPLPSRPIRLPRRWQWIAVAVAALLVLVGIIVAAQNSQPGDPLYNVRLFIESILPGGAAPLPIETPIPTQTAIPDATHTETATPLPTETATPTASETPALTAEVTGVIEGPVTAINGRVIVIYGIEIELPAADPLLTVIEVGDVIRVEGDFSEGGATIIVTTVVIVDVEVVVNETGEVWRDSGNCDNPPPDWAPANGWRRRCEGGAAPGGGGGNQGMGMGSGS